MACPNPDCTYFGCGVETIHAMVSCGVRGKTDHIQRWKCQASGTTVSEHKFTPLYHLKTPPRRISLVLALLANGLDPSAARMFPLAITLDITGYHFRQVFALHIQSSYCYYLSVRPPRRR